MKYYKISFKRNQLNLENMMLETTINRACFLTKKDYSIKELSLMLTQALSKILGQYPCFAYEETTKEVFDRYDSTGNALVIDGE